MSGSMGEKGEPMASETLRVLHVIGTMDRAGAETFLMNLYRLLGPKGIQFDFLIHGDAPCDYEPEIRALGGEVHRLPARFCESLSENGKARS